ncbi:MAG: MFS transporter [Alphaproteobacteria bacterium]|nr:MAG: MFS transporter [Alphaproteobacteria bacterium]
MTGTAGANIADSADGGLHDRKARRNVMVLAAAQAIAGAAAPMNIAVSALAGYSLLAQDKSLATVPITAFVLGTACGTVPAALLMRHVGRRAGLITGMLIGAIGGLTGAGAMGIGSFWTLCLGTFLMGFSNAFVQQFRFAAADTASVAFRPKAISLVLAGGIVAAVLGPQTVIHSRDLIGSVPYAGAFLAASAFLVAGAMILIALDIPKPPAVQRSQAGRPLLQIARRPRFLIAVTCAITAYALMILVMTAAPLAMVGNGHSQDSATLGIQWHVLAMFGPSFFTGSLIVRFGAERIIAIGLVILIGCALVALSGVSIAHFWTALVLLGVGWNFGFIGGTALVTETYEPVEKERVQALNDFLIFGFVVLASFLSGTILVSGGWNAVNLSVLPIAVICLAGLGWLEIRARKRGLREIPSP